MAVDGFNPGNGPTSICVHPDECCQISLHFVNKCGDPVSAFGALIEFREWRSFADAKDGVPCIYKNNQDGFGIDNHCPEEGTFIVSLCPDDWANLCIGGEVSLCWDVKVTYPFNEIASGFVATAEGSNTLTPIGLSDVSAANGTTVMMLDTGPVFVVDQEIIGMDNPKGFLTEACAGSCGFPETVSNEPEVTPGPTGNLVAENVSLDTDMSAAYKIFTTEVHHPPQMRGSFKVSHCCPIVDSLTGRYQAYYPAVS